MAVMICWRPCYSIFNPMRMPTRRGLCSSFWAIISTAARTRAVISRLMALSEAGWCDVVCLMGNHEASMLHFLEDPAEGAAWLQFGGNITLASYGVAATDENDRPKSVIQLRDDALTKIDPAHREWLSQLSPYVQMDDYLFVHAGVDPRKHLADQDGETFYWIREPFLNARKSCEFVVVHGHTPATEASNLRWRIGLDTGAYATGMLSAARLWQDERFIFASRA